MAGTHRIALLIYLLFLAITVRLFVEGHHLAAYAILLAVFVVLAARIRFWGE